MPAQNRIIVLCAVLSIVLMAFSVHAAPVSLSWTAPSTNQNGTPLTDLAGHKVHYGLAPQSYTVVVEVGLATSALISGLDAGRTYYFAVTAYDTSGNQSAFSTEVPYTIPLADTDGDGLSDEEEDTVYGTDPNKADTDGDGLNDGAEVTSYGTNPTKADTDGDGLNDGAEVAQGTDPTDPDSEPEAGEVVAAVNAGGAQVTAGDGTKYEADRWFSGGKTYSTTAAIADTTDDALYRSERYGNFSYNIPLATGDYVVTLKFAEVYFSAAGKRVFDVLMEGVEVVSNLDIVAQAGGKNKAYDVKIPVHVADGVLNIVFRSQISNAKVSAIIIESDQESDPGDPAPEPEAGEVVAAVNAGGAQVTAGDGTTYLADRWFSGGNTYSTTAAIADTTDDALYRSERYGNFSYNIPVANGDYVVTLKFAEIYFSAAGQRVFDVQMEGDEVVDNLDIFAQVGKNRAYDLEVPVRVMDGVLNIVFRNVISNAKVSAITIAAP